MASRPQRRPELVQVGVGDHEPAEHEEQVDAERARGEQRADQRDHLGHPGQRREVEVEEHHPGRRDDAQPGQPTQLARRSRGSRTGSAAGAGSSRAPNEIMAGRGACRRRRPTGMPHRLTVSRSCTTRSGERHGRAAGNAPATRRLPAIEVQHPVERLARRRPERLAGVVGGGQQHALAHLRRDAEQLGDLPLVAQVQRGPRAAQPAGPGRELVAPRGRQQRAPQPGLVAAPAARRPRSGSR